MLKYPRINPNIIEIGHIRVRWYGLMYVLGFLSAYLLIPKQKRAKEIGLEGKTLQDLIFYLALGLVIGARFGYILFYQYANLGFYLRHPVEIIATWHGGMSFHGGLIGCIAAGYLFSRNRKMPFWAIADSVAVTAPIGLGLGRIGNFINGELYGRVTNVPWAMVFPNSDGLPRHPSQLYEALFEGLVLFIILWKLRKKDFPDGYLVVFFLLFYGIFRFFLEFFREPDPQIGFIFGFLSMGQILCLCMVIFGIGFLLVKKTKNNN